MAKINKKSNSSNSNLVQYNVTDSNGNFIAAFHVVDEVEKPLIDALIANNPKLTIVAKEDYSSKAKDYAKFA